MAERFEFLREAGEFQAHAVERRRRRIRHSGSCEAFAVVGQPCENFVQPVLDPRDAVGLRGLGGRLLFRVDPVRQRREAMLEVGKRGGERGRDRTFAGLLVEQIEAGLDGRERPADDAELFAAGSRMLLDGVDLGGDERERLAHCKRGPLLRRGDADDLLAHRGVGALNPIDQGLHRGGRLALHGFGAAAAVEDGGFDERCEMGCGVVRRRRRARGPEAGDEAGQAILGRAGGHIVRRSRRRSRYRTWRLGRCRFVLRARDDGIQPFAQRHPGAARGFLGRLAGIGTDAFHAPGYPLLH